MEDLEALREYVSDEFQSRGFTDRRSLVQLLRDIADDLDTEEAPSEDTAPVKEIDSLRAKLTSKFGNMVQ